MDGDSSLCRRLAWRVANYPPDQVCIGFAEAAVEVRMFDNAR